MHITDISRKGTSTIFGTLIFVGIMFTAVIPMLLVMKQADTLHEMRKYELEILDYERSSEDLYIYVYPEGDLYSTYLKVTAQNKGELLATVVRLWINDDPYDLNVALQPMSEVQKLGTYELSPADDESFFITVTTDRGRSIASDTPLTWLGEYTGWSTGETLAINVLISSLPGHVFKIEIYDGESLIVWGMTEKFDPKFFIGLLSDVLYTVKIFRGSNLLYMKGVTIIWPAGPPVEWVFA